MQAAIVVVDALDFLDAMLELVLLRRYRLELSAIAMLTSQGTITALGLLD